jgi:hypothetical protein
MTNALMMICALMIPVLGTAQQQNTMVKQIEKAVESLTQAMIHADGDALHRLTAEKLSYGHSSGKVESKAQFIESLLSGESDFEDIKLADQTVEVVGNTAIVRHVLSAQTNDRGKGSGTVKLNILLVWVKEKGQWLLLARQAVRVP